jgi:hypothetical protein
MSRRKSFKKSLRESFRRLRKGRSQRPNAAPKTIPTSPPSQEAASSSSGPTTAAEVRPVERQIEARPVDDGLGSMVRCLLMAKTYVISQSQQTTPTLWAGTNSGAIYVFNLLIPAGTRYCTLTEAGTKIIIIYAANYRRTAEDGTCCCPVGQRNSVETPGTCCVDKHHRFDVCVTGRLS